MTFMQPQIADALLDDDVDKLDALISQDNRVGLPFFRAEEELVFLFHKCVRVCIVSAAVGYAVTRSLG